MTSINLNGSDEATNDTNISQIVEDKKEVKREYLTRLLITCSLVIMLGVLIYATVAA